MPTEITFTSLANDTAEAVRRGIEIARAADDKACLAVYGHKAPTGYRPGSSLDLVCRDAAQDEAKRLAD